MNYGAWGRAAALAAAFRIVIRNVVGSNPPSPKELIDY